MNDGWICLHRKFLKWKWRHNPQMVHLFIHLLLSANHTNTTWRGNVIKRGQLLTGRIQLSTETGLSQQTIRTCLLNLKSTNEIEIVSTNKFSLITLIKYEDYQYPYPSKKSTGNQPAKNQEINQQNNPEKSINTDSYTEFEKKSTSKKIENQPAKNTEINQQKNEKSTTNNNNTSTNTRKEKRENTRKEKREKKKEKNEKMKLPDWIDCETWKAYLEMRRLIKKPMTLHAQNLAIRTLEKFKAQGYDTQEILNQSIQNSWQGLFLPREEVRNGINKTGGVKPTAGKYANIADD